jgi:hypothetical protein
MEEDVLEAAFEKEMYKIYRDAYAKCKYNAHIFHGMLQDLGGLPESNLDIFGVETESSL